MKYYVTLRYGSDSEQKFELVDSYNLSLKYKRDIDNGRMNFNISDVNLSFINNAYQYILSYFNQSQDICNELYLKIYIECNNELKEACYFSYSKEKILIDLDMCVATLGNGIDRSIIGCALTTLNFEDNGINHIIPLTQFTYNQSYTLDFCGLLRDDNTPLQCCFPYNVNPCTIDDGNVTYYGLSYTETIPSGIGDCHYDIYAKRCILVPYCNDNDVRPEIEGNYYYAGDLIIGLNKYAKFCQPTSIKPNSHNWGLLVSCITQIGVPSPDPSYIIMSGQTNPCCNTLEIWADPINFDTVIPTRGGKLIDFITSLFTSRGCGQGVISDFFEWNPVGDAPNYQPGYNYVYSNGILDFNQYNDLFIIQKSDLKKWNSPNAATFCKIKLKEVLQWLYNEFQCLYYITSDGFLRIEHVSYFYAKPEIYLDADNVIYPHNKIPYKEHFKNMEQFNLGFVSCPITYDCADFENEIIYENDRLTTDIDSVILDKENISDDGWVIVACAFDVPNHVAYPFNEPMKRTVLNERFWKHWRYDKQFIMNQNITNYKDILKPIFRQQNILIKKCCDDLELESPIQTDLINNLYPERKGLITDYELNLTNGYITANIIF